MSSTLLHSALTIGGIVIGISATLALTPSSSTSSSSNKKENNSLISRPSGSGTLVNVDGGNGGVIQRQIGPIADFLTRSAYVTSYNRSLKIPSWTAEHLTLNSLAKIPIEGGTNGGGGGGGGGDRSNSKFREDEEIPERFRAKLEDYFKSGFDRGHLVPAADAKSTQIAMNETFLLSNIAPQVGDGFNRHYWAYLEAFCRNLTKEFQDVYVFTVPLFLPRFRLPSSSSTSPSSSNGNGYGNKGKWIVEYEMIGDSGIGKGRVAVPTHFAKVILTSKDKNGFSGNGNGNGGEKDWSMGTFVLPNEVIDDKIPLVSFLVPVEVVENSAGLELFSEEMKRIAKPLCQTTNCSIIVRRFDDSQKSLTNGNGNGKNNRKKERSNSI